MTTQPSILRVRPRWVLGTLLVLASCAPGRPGSPDGGVPAASGPAVRIVATEFGHACAVANQGALHCFGLGEWGELGNGDTKDALTPVRVGAGRWSMVSAGDYHPRGTRRRHPLVLG